MGNVAEKSSHEVDLVACGTDHDQPINKAVEADLVNQGPIWDVKTVIHGHRGYQEERLPLECPGRACRGAAQYTTRTAPQYAG